MFFNCFYPQQKMLMSKNSKHNQTKNTAPQSLRKTLKKWSDSQYERDALKLFEKQKHNLIDFKL